nr:reverse transcriptase domain-containing protein [Tanacetum cinerariifolium]
MSELADLIPTTPTFAVRNTMGKGNEQTLENPNRPTSDAALREYGDKYYDQLLPIITEKVHKEKAHQDKLKEVISRLNFEGCSGKNSKIQEVSQHSEFRTPNVRDPFTPRICYFDFPKKTRMPSNIKTYDRSEDPEDHLKFFQEAVKVERRAMPTWCHMFNSTLIGSARVWFDDLPPEFVDSYDDLKKAFLANFLQQKKCIKDPVEIHHIKQREGESIEDFVQRFKSESRHVKGAPECMRISRFMHRITKLDLIKRLHDNIPKLVDEMMRRSERRREKFTLLTKSPKEILALDKGKFKTPPSMTTPVEKRNNKFCEFYEKVGHNTDECMHLKRQIEELIKAGKLSHVIKELKQGNGKDQPKTAKKGKASENDKAMAILMVQPWQRMAMQMVKEYQENDKIGSKPNNNGKRGKAGKSLKQLQQIEEEKPNKTQKEGP